MVAQRQEITQITMDFVLKGTIITFSILLKHYKRPVSHVTPIKYIARMKWIKPAIFEIPIKDWYLSGGCSNIGMEPWLVRISQVVTRLRHKGLTLLQTTKSQNQILSSWLNSDLILIWSVWTSLSSSSLWKGFLSWIPGFPDFFYGCQVSLNLAIG